MRADHTDALALKDRGDAGKQPIVAAAKELRQPRRSFDGAPVEPEIRKLGSRHCADDHHLGDRALFQCCKELADLAHSNPYVRIGFDRRMGRADHSDQKRSRPARRASPATSSGKAPAPA